MPGSGSAAFLTVTFRQTYATPPLVFVMPTNDASTQATVRIRNVTTTGFEIAHVYADGGTAGYPALTLDYIAIEPGLYNVGGLQVEARFIDTRRYQSKFGGASWNYV